MENQSLLGALMTIAFGLAAIGTRKAVVSSYMKTFKNPSKAIPPKTQEQMQFALGMLFICFGLVVLILWAI